ncbi:Carboxymuconolactone decarboxylase family [Achromobacter xylosoxidans]|uniref:carboxymuconolactone decarboxylase family protein n=1 Tax=Alcaligenes xylosoxydans xylosoxydans TaxID=85698 RepID=UPI0006BF64B0|nr:carboxymuconolactone decarboxylase family protein [Achromobacter xylosoxidans]MDX3880722.1 carboxymuconolactone decarboxylase family protein [Achromobacter sp.]CUJ39063.1 Carboxymuconolactone decarboxylase family [Achromobacter xylosoxidans]CUJ50468.1 Carboxymuconolactone decarboxylase family [Achromobacter xylosoxidans]
MSSVNRLRPQAESEISPAQRELHARLMSGPRGAIVGPFNVWLRRPGLADIADRFGKYCRFDAVVDRRLAELVIMQVAQHTGAEFEWEHHYPYALEAGLSADQLAELKRGEPMSGLDAQAGMVFRVVAELLRMHTLDTATYEQAVDVLGEDLLIDLVGVAGYYMFVSLTINVFGI